MITAIKLQFAFQINNPLGMTERDLIFLMLPLASFLGKKVFFVITYLHSLAVDIAMTITLEDVSSKILQFSFVDLCRFLFCIQRSRAFLCFGSKF